MNTNTPHPPENSASKPSRAPLAFRVAAWALTWSPALLILLLLVPLRVPLPFEDSWAFIAQYQDWWQGDYGWRDFLKPHNNHPSAAGKLIYFAVLHWQGGSVALLPVFAWVFSLAIALAVALIAWRQRPISSAGGGGVGMLAVFCANLTIFTAAQGHAWIWDFVFQNFIPGAAFCSALALLWRLPGSWLALTGAAVLALAATFSFGTGFLAGLHLAPVIWLHFAPKWPVLPRGILTGAWLIFVLAGAWLALRVFGDATDTGDASRMGSLLSEPVTLVRFVTCLLGYALGNGATLEPGVLCPLLGVFLLVVLAVCLVRLWQLRQQPGVFHAALPWLLITAFGLGNALLISYGRYRFSLISAMAPRYVTFTLFFTLGVLMLAVTVNAMDSPGGWFRGVSRRVGPVLCGVFLTLQALNWNHGWQHMKWEHERMKQDRAMLHFARILPLDPEVMWQNLLPKRNVTDLALFLHEKERLRGVRLLDSVEVADYRKGSILPEKWAWIDTPVVQDGVVRLTGACGVSKDMVSLPDLILITVQPEGGSETILTFAIPRQPFDFYENEWLRRQHVEHYFGWSRTLKIDRFPKGHHTIRAHGFWVKGRTLRALDRQHVLEL